MIDLVMEQKNRRVLAEYYKAKAAETTDVTMKAEYLERGRVHKVRAEMAEMEKKAPKKVVKACPKCEKQCG